MAQVSWQCNVDIWTNRQINSVAIGVMEGDRLGHLVIYDTMCFKFVLLHLDSIKDGT
jgi:hypothetical protein